jgi:hypothetical protein
VYVGNYPRKKTYVKEDLHTTTTTKGKKGLHGNYLLSL